MKSRRFKYEYRKNASKLHRKVGDILRESITWGHYEIYQEYPVNRVNTKYANGAHKFDWVIPKLKIVIECHGKQHYEVQTFGAEIEDAISAFNDQQYRDKAKKEAALQAGWIYIEIPYTLENKITEHKLLQMFWEAEKESEEYLKDYVEENNEPTTQEVLDAKNKEWAKKERERYLSSEGHSNALQKAREYRKQRYRRLKELKNGS